MLLRKISILYSLIAITLFCFSCDEDGENSDLGGTMNIEITDAPIDDASVNSAFVTVSEIKIDGKTIEGFNKTTIDLLAYQQGNTKLLASSQLDADTYSQISLVLDFDNDENGDSPGCYIVESSGATKHQLSSTSNELTIDHNFEVTLSAQTNIVLDFDLRKSVVREQGGSDHYEFVTQSELENSIRAVNKSNAGIISGNCDDQSSNSDVVVVYAYKKGTYDAITEFDGQGQSNVRFAKAVTSSTINTNGDFQLNFLEEGEYELHYVGFEENDEGEMILKGGLTLDVLSSVDIESIDVSASSETTVDVSITGILPI